MAAPSLQQLDASIALSEVYLDGLYKPLSSGTAVQSEAYGLPLRLWLAHYERWVLLGEGEAGDCLAGAPCTGPTTIWPTGVGTRGSSSESYSVAFDTPAKIRSVTAEITLNWALAGGRFSVVTMVFRSTDPGAAGAELWLDQTKLATLPGDPTSTTSVLSIGGPVTRVFPLSATFVTRSLRYTVRHATQSAYLYWTLRARGSDSEAAVARAGALEAFLRTNGYVPGKDIRAAGFGQADGLPQDFPFDEAAYPDCKRLPARTASAYPYASKVCLLGVRTFLLAGRADAFLQTSQALLVLGTTGDPDARYPALVSLGLPSKTPRGTAQFLRDQWDRLGYGIPSCTPAACETFRASGLRTFQFGELATLLSYGHGRKEFASYADAAAAQAIALQIDAKGHIRTLEGDVTRPAQRGSFPIFFDASHRFVPTTGTTAAATERLSMPPEGDGISVSSSETTFDAWAFLTAYRCARYRVGCIVAPYGRLLGASTDSASPPAQSAGTR